jgi:hypothetical protein
MSPVVVAYDANRRDIAKMLRQAASALEMGEFPGAQSAALVLDGREIQVYGFGAATSGETHLLLHAGAAKLVRSTLGQEG